VLNGGGCPAEERSAAKGGGGSALGGGGGKTSVFIALASTAALTDASACALGGEDDGLLLLDLLLDLGKLRSSSTSEDPARRADLGLLCRCFGAVDAGVAFPGCAGSALGLELPNPIPDITFDTECTMEALAAATPLSESLRCLWLVSSRVLLVSSQTKLSIVALSWPSFSGGQCTNRALNATTH
jgi:hypothetical protein